MLTRDLKVDNIMISADRKVKLIDFGLLVRLPPGKSEYQGSQTGTIGYFAPESIPLSGRAKFSPKSDIWQA
ncbi:Shark, partial [Symbiodinium microadriaticum]